MDINIEKDVLKVTDEYTVTVYNLIDMPFLNYAHIDTKELCVSLDMTTILFYAKQSDENCKTLKSDQIVNHMVDYLNLIREKYEQAKKDNDPHSAFYLLDKRDITNQFFKCVINESFSDDALYDYGLKCYRRIEDDYGYKIIFPILKDLRNDGNIKAKIKDSLKLELDKDGFVTVYRGFNSHSRLNGTSFTLSKKVAQFFANRWDTDTKVIKKYKVHVDDVVAYAKDHEQEILTDKAIEIE